jgi:phosphopantothenoylcysteine decarboxylase/phosphopantothenate--cysteine ligase
MSKSNLNSDFLQKQKNILILMSGSIACYKVCTVISQLKQKNYSVKVVMSEAAAKFIGPATIEGLLGEAPIVDMYKSGSVMDHIHLARWADLILLAPATANTINKMAAGLGDDLISTLFLAHDLQKPFLVTPAMNTKMYLHPTTQKSLIELKKMGLDILETASGVLACGEVGYGRLLEPELIISEVEARATKALTTEFATEIKVLNRKKVLITSGGTQEPIDDVRFISNHSTGRTASFIADQMIESGFDVTFIHAKNSKIPVLDCHKKNYVTFKDLDTLLTQTLSENKFDVVVHTAAVSDYSVTNSAIHKIDSSADEITLLLKKNPKLINKIKTLAPLTTLIGFKLTSTNDEQIIKNKLNGLFKNAQCDYVVHNDWSTIQTGQTIFSLNTATEKTENLDLPSLASEIIQIILKKDTL